MDHLEKRRLRELITGFWLSKSIYVVAKLGIPDLIRQGKSEIGALAEASGTKPDALYRVLRALASRGLFVEEPRRSFRLTPMGELLASDASGSLRHYAIMMGEEQYTAFSELLEAVKTGESVFAKIFKDPMFPYLQRHPEAGHTFQMAMTAVTAEQIAAVVEAYDFSGIGTLVDVGAGLGSLLLEVLGRYPQMRGVLFDLPDVARRAKAEVEKSGLGVRLQIHSGDFFTEVPDGGDAYLLKYILHDWDDERCTAILKTVHKAMKGCGKLLIAELVIPSGNEPFFGKFSDLHMLVLFGGKERSEEEFHALLAGAGFRISRIVPTTYVSVIEAVPV